eukprot:PhM_4_TR6152/c0_g1_i1/m.52320
MSSIDLRTQSREELIEVCKKLASNNKEKNQRIAELTAALEQQQNSSSLPQDIMFENERLNQQVNHLNKELQTKETRLSNWKERVRIMSDQDQAKITSLSSELAQSQEREKEMTYAYDRLVLELEGMSQRISTETEATNELRETLKTIMSSTDYNNNNNNNNNNSVELDEATSRTRVIEAHGEELASLVAAAWQHKAVATINKMSSWKEKVKAVTKADAERIAELEVQLASSTTTTTNSTNPTTSLELTELEVRRQLEYDAALELSSTISHVQLLLTQVKFTDMMSSLTSELEETRAEVDSLKAQLEDAYHTYCASESFLHQLYTRELMEMVVRHGIECDEADAFATFVEAAWTNRLAALHFEVGTLRFKCEEMEARAVMFEEFTDSSAWSARFPFVVNEMIRDGCTAHNNAQCQMQIQSIELGEAMERCDVSARGVHDEREGLLTTISQITRSMFSLYVFCDCLMGREKILTEEAEERLTVLVACAEGVVPAIMSTGDQQAHLLFDEDRTRALAANLFKKLQQQKRLTQHAVKQKEMILASIKNELMM